MIVEWLPEAQKRLNEIALYSAKSFGKKAALKLIEQFERKENQLTENPEMGHPEPLLIGHTPTYRSLSLPQQHCKLVYYADSKADTLYIVDLWDTRTNPIQLAARFTSDKDEAL